MELNKCARCGNFFVSNNSICPKCSPKDTQEMSTLKKFFADNDSEVSLENISNTTGITMKNLNRFINEKEFASFRDNLESANTNEGNISINL